MAVNILQSLVQRLASNIEVRGTGTDSKSVGQSYRGQPALSSHPRSEMRGQEPAPRLMPSFAPAALRRGDTELAWCGSILSKGR